ncbi:MAG: hypothetical protein WBD40_25845 [Tepidisphaeraceae bacterium]
MRSPWRGETAIRHVCRGRRVRWYHATVPTIVDYERVLQRMEADGFRSLYHNSGAFGFPRAADVRYAGWIGPPDASIRSEALEYVRHVDPPYESNLARLAGDVWTNHVPGTAWLMPMSHWSYELDLGSKEWMPAALAAIGVDATQLAGRVNGSAIAFEPGERDALEALLMPLLANLRTSDFMLAFVGRAALCTVHHHNQLWWQTTDAALHEVLMSVVL